MEKIYNPQRETWSEIIKRPVKPFEEIEKTVSIIFKEVRDKGDLALTKYTEIFDQCKIENFIVDKSEIENSDKEIGSDLKDAIDVAKNNIEKFHSSQKTEKKIIETSPGVECWQESRAIERVGLYIPGGTAPLFSSVLMLAIPAKIAGCKEIILCTPPNKEGEINPAIIYAAKVSGVDKIIKAGGIQAIAALTFGTEQILKVDKIFGPGNQFVTAAKQYATKFNIAIDMPAGPSELLVLADSTANPSYIASDLLSQAEHGGDSQVVLITTDKNILEESAKEVQKQIEDLPRKEIAKKAIQNSKLILVDSLEKAMEFSNLYAPEHLIIISKEENFLIEKISNAGSVFIGNYSPESAGDYASGTNHTLPTNANSKAYSGINLDAYCKKISFQKLSREGLQNIASSIETMAEAEGLFAHKNAVSIRLK